MKKITVFVLIISLGFLLNSSTSKTQPVFEKETYSKFNEGFKDGWCDGYKDSEGCGSLAICPISPIPPIPEIGQSSDSYKDGYGTGFKAGLRRGMKDCQ